MASKETHRTDREERDEMTTERAAEIVFVGGPERNLTIQQVLEYADRNPGERHFLENAPAYKVARYIRAEAQKDAS